MAIAAANAATEVVVLRIFDPSSCVSSMRLVPREALPLAGVVCSASETRVVQVEFGEVVPPCSASARTSAAAVSTWRRTSAAAATWSRASTAATKA